MESANFYGMDEAQLRGELIAAWTRLHNVRDVLDNDFERPVNKSTPMRENIAGDVLMHLHAMRRKIEKLTAERDTWEAEATELRNSANAIPPRNILAEELINQLRTDGGHRR